MVALSPAWDARLPHLASQLTMGRTVQINKGMEWKCQAQNEQNSRCLVQGLVWLPNCLLGKVWVAQAALPSEARTGMGEKPKDGATRQEPQMGWAVPRTLGLEAEGFERKWHYLFSYIFAGYLLLLSAKQGSGWQGHAGDRGWGCLVPAKEMSLC